jgi:hypothetical protein
MTQARAPRRLPSALGAIALVVFFLYSLSFLYFFVDDEGIAFVFARNLLEGRGFVYNSFEGRVEGYSDFLHVLLSTVWLALLRAAGVDAIGLFFVGKAISMAAALATIWVAFTLMRRSDAVRPEGAAAGLAFLALAGPLAMWSCSSLEAASVGALTIALVAALQRNTGFGDALAAIFGCLLVLLRIDGFVHAGAVVASMLVFGDAQRRRIIFTRVCVPLAVLFVGYHVWRYSYFGEWLTAPLHSKVLHKLTGSTGLVVNAPDRHYALAFLDTYGWPLAAVALLAMSVTVVRDKTARPLLLSAVLMGGYAAIVGDWMAGFRFFVPVLPILSVLIAIALSRVGAPLGMRLVAGLLTVWFCWTAYGYATRYDPLEYRENWWGNPSLRVERFFGPYYGLLEAVQGRIPPGSRTAFNQAGFLPFMLDLDNIDDIGLCSLFVAKLPTTDVIFTEVGRYSPLTNEPALRTANAYLLYREPAYVIARMGILRSANWGDAPGQILAGRYQQILTDPAEEHVVYARTAAPVAPFQQNPRTFLENLAHPSRIRRAAWNVAPVAPADYVERLALLAGNVTHAVFEHRLQIDVEFSDVELPIYEVYVQEIRSAEPAMLILNFDTRSGTRVHQVSQHLAAGRLRNLRLEFPDGLRAARLTIDVVNLGGSAARVRLEDMRLQGQTPELATYVRQLPFPPR